jgi:hypothetical protein
MVEYRERQHIFINFLSWNFKAVGRKNIMYFNGYENIYFACITQRYISTMLNLLYIMIHYKTSITNVGTRIGLQQAHGIYKRYRK